MICCICQIQKVLYPKSWFLFVVKLTQPYKILITFLFLCFVLMWLMFCCRWLCQFINQALVNNLTYFCKKINFSFKIDSFFNLTFQN